MPVELQLLPATPADYATLAAIGHEAFHADKLTYGEGPDVYENPAFMQPLLNEQGVVRKLTLGQTTIGLAITFCQTNGCRWLGCLALLPAYQKQGYGTQAIALLEAAYPQTHTWGLDTPSANAGNLHFYQKVGYRVIDHTQPRPGFQLTVFEKKR